MADSGDDGMLILSLITLGAILRRLLDRDLTTGETGVSALEVALLRYLATGFATDTPRLAKQFGMSRQGMRHLLADLEERGLVEPKFVDPPQPSAFALTKDGAFMTSLGLAGAADLEQRLIGGADDATREALQRVITKLHTMARDRPWRLAAFSAFR